MIKHITIAIICSLFFTANAYALDSLIEHMKKAIEFEENNYTILATSEKFAEKRLSQNRTFAGFPETIAKTKRLLDKIEKYQRGNFSPNSLLRDAFGLRFEQIGISSVDYLENMRDSLSDGHERSDSYWSIANNNIEPLKEKDSPDAQWNHIIGRTSLDRFQLMSNLIKEILWDMKQKERSLTDENQLWLRCARTLHPLLRGQVNLLEKPERAIAANVPDDYDRNFEDELELCSHYHLPKIAVKVANQTLGAKEYGLECSIDVTAHEFLHLPNAIKKTAKKTPSRSIDPRLPTFNYPSELELFLVEENAITPQEIDTDSTDNNETNSESGSETETDSSNTNQWHENDPMDGLRVDVPHESIALDEIEVGEGPSKQEELEIVFPLDGENYDYFEKNEEIDQRQAHLAFQAIKATQQYLDVPKINSREDSLRIWVNSRLKTTQYNWLRGLLKNEMTVISYKDFSTVWKRLNGNNTIIPSKKGSSHFKLLNSYGEVVGGIFTHGKGQEYWGSAVHDIKQNFIALGLNEDLLDNN